MKGMVLARGDDRCDTGSAPSPRDPKCKCTATGAASPLLVSSLGKWGKGQTLKQRVLKTALLIQAAP